MNDWIFDLILDALDHARASVDATSHFWTWLVIFGVALEVIFLCVDHFSDWGIWHRSKTRGTLSFPEKPSAAKLILEIVGVGDDSAEIWIGLELQ